ncbi:chemosensory receptor A [Elysia marginata]|uniref:Chemosensory receptor A n=1 Tax=Elysia marginata TaxID=1093978 RepID=A0AAV4GG13_9GAST|nr:chemosensory receptor A [Elysia marginata]
MSVLSTWHLDTNSSLFNPSVGSNPLQSAHQQDLSSVDLVFTGFNLSVYVFSSLANFMNILVFWRDGFVSTSNISFFTLAIADLLVSLIWVSQQVAQLTSQVYTPLGIFLGQYLFPCSEAINTLASWITVIITWERLCCISFPLKVKAIVTRKLIVSLILGGAMYELTAVIVGFVGVYIALKGSKEIITIPYFDENGGYRLNITNTETRDFGASILKISFMYRSTIPNYILYAAIVIGTVLLVFKFWQSVRVKQSLMAVKGPQKMSAAEKRLIKSVVAVCVIYIVTVTPLNLTDTLYFIDSNLVPLNVLWVYVLMLAVSLTRSFNHAINIFVYLVVNSNYRKQFINLFCFGSHA